MFALRRLALSATRAATRPAVAAPKIAAFRIQSIAAAVRCYSDFPTEGGDRYQQQGERYGSVQRENNFGGDRAAMAPTKVVYVGNLKYECTEKELEEKFSEYGDVRGVRIPRTGETGVARGFAYIEFANLTESAEAIEAMHQAPFHGRRLNVQYVNRADMRIKSNPESKTLFIGNLSFNTTDEDLNELFKDIPGCADVRVAMDRRTGQPRGFVHADFTDVESAVAAKEKLAGTQLYGRQIRIDFSVPPEDRKKIYEERAQLEDSAAESGEKAL